MVKLSAESSTAGDREFDTTIKFNASTGDEFDFHVVPESLQTQSWFASHLPLFSPETSKLESAVYSELFTTAECTEKKQPMSMKEDLINIFAPPFNRAVKHIKIPRLPRDNAVYRDLDEYFNKQIKTSRKRKRYHLTLTPSIIQLHPGYFPEIS